MPIYEYTCVDCSHESEQLIRGQEVPACPKCNSHNLEKAWSIPAAHTSGSAAQLQIQDCGKPSCCRGQCDL